MRTSTPPIKFALILLSTSVLRLSKKKCPLPLPQDDDYGDFLQWTLNPRSKNRVENDPRTLSQRRESQTTTHWCSETLRRWLSPTRERRRTGKSSACSSSLSGISRRRCRRRLETLRVIRSSTDRILAATLTVIMPLPARSLPSRDLFSRPDAVSASIRRRSFTSPVCFKKPSISIALYFRKLFWVFFSHSLWLFFCDLVGLLFVLFGGVDLCPGRFHYGLRGSIELLDSKNAPKFYILAYNLIFLTYNLIFLTHCRHWIIHVHSQSEKITYIAKVKENSLKFVNS